MCFICQIEYSQIISNVIFLSNDITIFVQSLACWQCFLGVFFYLYISTFLRKCEKGVGFQGGNVKLYHSTMGQLYVLLAGVGASHLVYSIYTSFGLLYNVFFLFWYFYPSFCCDTSCSGLQQPLLFLLT